MTALPCRLTRAGLARVFNASKTGLAVTLSHIGLGRGRAGATPGYMPSGQETALAQEVLRVPIGSGDQLDAGTIAVQALLEAGALPAGQGAFMAFEMGLYLSDGTLFAIHADPAGPITWVSGNEALVFAASLALDEVPPGSVTWLAGGPSVNIMLGSEFATLALATLTITRRALASEAATARTVLNF